MQWYNTKTNECCGAPPWGDHFYEDSMKSKLFGDWVEKPDTFRPVDKPSEDYVWDSAQKKYVVSLPLARVNLDAEYDAYNLNNMRSYMGAMRRGDTDMANTILAEGKKIQDEYYAKKVKLNG